MLECIANWIAQHRRLPDPVEIIDEAERRTSFPKLSLIHKHFGRLDDAIVKVRTLVQDDPKYKFAAKVFEASSQ